MELLRKISVFGASHDEMKNIYILYIRSLIEQSCNVWHSGLQKSALKIILKESYKTYEHALNILDLENLFDRREYLFLKFAK